MTLAALLLLALAAPAAAASGTQAEREWGVNESVSRAVDPALPALRLDRVQVAAGRRIVLEWPRGEHRAEELEIVASIDGGEHYDVRVSPELSGDACRYVWTVPNLGAENVRLRLRLRIDGREVSGPVTRSFCIVPDPLCPPARWSFHAGEWWKDAAGEPFGLAGHLRPAPGPHLTSHVKQHHVVCHARVSVTPPTLRLRRTAAAPPRVATPVLPAPEVFAASRFPLRH